MGKAQTQFKVNIPEEVKQWLAAEAAKNLRSQTAEVILALKEKMRSQTQTQTEKADVQA